MRTIILLSLVLFLTECRNKTNNNEEFIKNKDHLFEINYEKALNNKKQINLSTIAAEVDYIILETKENCLIPKVHEIYFADSLIFVQCNQFVLVFNHLGKFLHQIGTPGQGPNEIDIVRHVNILPNRVLAIQTNWTHKLLFFTYKGEFVKSITLPYDILYAEILDENHLLFYSSCSEGFEDYLYILVDQSWDTIATVNNHFKWENNAGFSGMIGYSCFKPFYRFNGRLYFKSMYNDTVYTVSEKGIVPAYYIDLGKYRLPNELRPEPPQSALRWRKESGSYYFAGSIESENWIFISTFCYKGDFQRNIVYKKNTEETLFLVNKDDEPAGFINDIDGGLPFWPEGKLTGNSIYMEIFPYQLKDRIMEDDYRNSSSQYPVMKSNFRKMANQINENDNPLLMIVKLKK